MMNCGSGVKTRISNRIFHGFMCLQSALLLNERERSAALRARLFAGTLPPRGRALPCRLVPVPFAGEFRESAGDPAD